MCVFVVTSTDVKVNSSSSSDFQKMMPFTIRPRVLLEFTGCRVSYFYFFAENRPCGAENVEIAGYDSHAGHFVFEQNIRL